MYRLPFIACFLLLTSLLVAQSPHGSELKMNCIACHTTDGWEISPERWDFKEEREKKFSSSTGWEITEVDSSFNHFNTEFPLRGMHETVDCRSCHSTLVFNEASTQCIDCHLDVHSMTVGNDCIRCHTSENWLVDNIPEIHEENGFPLIGQHGGLSCVDCHTSETSLKFDRIGNDCYSCHQMDFESTESPNHINAGFSTNCIDCHSPEGDTWGTDIVDHSFFPLTLGHDIQDCTTCHITNNYSDASADCISCHQNDFSEALAPNHEALDFNIDCTQCHNTNPGWMPAEFIDHDSEFFPIYSGAHDGQWNECTDCHTDQDNYAVFTCISCHINPETDEEHVGISGYTYEDNACLACHPTGDSDMTFNHDNTNFPLTGSHIGVECLDCHSQGYEGTSTNCVDCHTMDFEASINPNHTQLNLPNDCINCHTTEPDWMPATFDIHDDFYPLEGAHAMIANDCATCHNGDYNNTPNTCVGCHLDDFNNTTDPNHEAANFPTDCTDCHTQDAWEPSTFDHDGEHFPIYSGKHEGEWNDCIDCHTNPSNFQEFQCVGCHINPETDEEHEGVSGYIYEDNACFACHPNGDADMAFDHDNTNFPLTGSHIGIECLDCHSQGFEGTSTNCVDCHTMDFEASINPNHTQLNLPNDCINCHTTEPDWMPAAFDIHDDFYPLEGAHAMIANDCATCHNGDYNNTPNTCVGCHLDDFNNTSDPDHVAANFSTDCIQCHNQEVWEPSTFDHNSFYPLVGAHAEIAQECLQCHSGGYENTPNTCVGCHQSDYDQTTDPNHMNAQFGTDCMACHNEDAWEPSTFDHDGEHFPIYSGEHEGEWNDCIDCHTNSSNYMIFTCIGCHLNPETDDEHNGVGGYIYEDNACFACHPTGEANEGINHDDTNFPLTGAHIMADCIDCHANGFQGTTTDCNGCHSEDFNGTSNPNHTALGISTDCISCHTTEPGWAPAAFDIHDDYYALTGAHIPIAADCAACHNGDYNNTPNDCVGCHQMDFEGTVNPNHQALNLPTDCINCHTTEPDWMPATFDIHDDFYPLEGAHAMIANDCATCHNGDYNNTPNTCVGCHLNDFNNTSDPDHEAANFSTDCIQCHNQDVWEPSTFDHNSFYPLVGAHAEIAQECLQCHSGGYENTPNTCVGCHQSDYDQTTDPNHMNAQFGTDCMACHNEDAWEPSTFDHDGEHFPIYSGEHEGEWNDCMDCHTNSSNYMIFTCIGCHLNPETDDEHNAVGGYIYEDNACFACHPTGEASEGINHDDTNFPLTGAHIMADCIDCHANGYQGTTTDCNGCHSEDFNGSTNPNHTALGISTDCISCHTTELGWAPATFDTHDDYYALTGAHIPIAADCAACHNGDYNNTPNDCVGCHQDDYNASVNPNHQSLSIPTDCISCHTTEPGWTPATFDIHDDYYPLTGAHLPIASECATCHNGDYNNTPSECVGCHQVDFEASVNPDHQVLNLSTDCIACHTTDPDWMPATFDVHNDYYPLNGAHALIANDCTTCHNGDYNNTPNTCVGCHQIDYNNTTNPNHAAAMFSTECLDCHTEDAWIPSTFDHSVIWPLNGAHAAIANECLQCHASGYENTPNTCIGCHQSDYDNTNNPDHAAAMFPTDCTECHNESAWEPSTFDHDNQYFPIYSGKHEGEWNLCMDCHINSNDYSIFSCIDCHEHDNQNEVDNDHEDVSGYIYESNACFACHPNGED